MGDGGAFEAKGFAYWWAENAKPGEATYFKLSLEDVTGLARAAWDAATERAAGVVEDHDPADVYLTDAGGEEFPEKASWDSQKEFVAARIRGGA